MFDNFQKEKSDFLSKKDKSKKGSIDKHIVKLVNSINSKEDFYTTLHITNEKYKSDLEPIDAACKCPTCRRYSRAYLRHLFSVGEPLGQRLTSLHNVYFYLELMRRIRASIRAGNL